MSTISLFVPPIATKLTLAEPWTFVLFAEYRNESFIEKLIGAGYKIPPRKERYGAEQLCNITLPAGAVLSVQRIYIRCGKREYDSLTFAVRFSTVGVRSKKVTGRFWAKLADVNRLQLVGPLTEPSTEVTPGIQPDVTPLVIEAIELAL